MSFSQTGDEMEGVEVESTPLLTAEEKRVLDVYDRLEELQLEIALLKAQGVLSQGRFTILPPKYALLPTLQILLAKHQKKTPKLLSRIF